MAVGRVAVSGGFRYAGASWSRPWLRFPPPLIEPDLRISRIRLSDGLHDFIHGTSCPSRLGVPAQMPVEMRERIAPALRRLTLCLKRNHRRSRTAV